MNQMNLRFYDQHLVIRKMEDRLGGGYGPDEHALNVGGSGVLVYSNHKKKKGKEKDKV